MRARIGSFGSVAKLSQSLDLLMSEHFIHSLLIFQRRFSLGLERQYPVKYVPILPVSRKVRAFLVMTLAMEAD